jgi:hypothetical protein
MSNWRWKLLGVVTLLAVVGYLWARGEKEPVYKGRPISRYLNSINSSSHLEYVRRVCERPGEFSKPKLTATFDDRQTLDAVSAVGTNALRLLTRELRTKERSFERLATRHPFIARLLPLRRRPSPKFRRLAAFAALSHLGPRAKGAVPDLLPLLRDPVCAPGVLVVLQAIRLEREEDISALTNVFKMSAQRKPYDWMERTPVEWVQGAAIIELLTYETKAQGAVPVLIATAKSTNSWLQGLAALALPRIGAPAEQAVPLIVNHLTNIKTPVTPTEDPPSAMSEAYGLLIENVRLNVIALGEFGKPAAAGLPALTRFHDEVPRDLDVKEATEWAIARIQANVTNQPQ